MNWRKICVYDFETDDINPETCNPVQLAAKMYDPRKLTLMDGGTFSSWIKPEGIEDLKTYLTDKRKETVEWHARNYSITPEEIIKRWKKAPSQQKVWKSFVAFVSRFNTKGSLFTAPIRAGANIRNFDNIIVDRMNQSWNDGKGIFFRRDILDVQDFCASWFENLAEPTSYSMDNLRKFFGMEQEGGHDALKDVDDEAEIIFKFLKLQRSISKRVNFKGAFAQDEIAV